MFIKGVSFGFMGKNGYYRSEVGQREADNICATGAKWVALIVTVAQERYSSTRMFADYVYTPSDVELASMVRKFHAAGVKVMLKPMIECLDSVWRGNIRFPEKQMMITGRSGSATMPTAWNTTAASVKRTGSNSSASAANCSGRKIRRRSGRA